MPGFHTHLRVSSRDIRQVLLREAPRKLFQPLPNLLSIETGLPPIALTASFSQSDYGRFASVPLVTKVIGALPARLKRLFIQPYLKRVLEQFNTS